MVGIEFFFLKRDKKNKEKKKKRKKKRKKREKPVQLQRILLSRLSSLHRKLGEKTYGAKEKR